MARVIDMTSHSAAYGTRLLAEGGHDVIRVEPRDGDSLRRLGPFLGDKPGMERGAFHQFLNAGKRSFTPDLDSAAGRELVLKLVEKADVLIANAPLAFDQGELLDRNPRVVLVRVEDDLPEICAYAKSGLLTLTGHPGQRPVLMGGHVAYSATGLHVAVAAAAAILVQQLTGEGQVVDVSIQQCMEELVEQSMVAYVSTGKGVERRGYRGAVTAVSGAFPCADGYWMVSVPHQPESWARFMEWVQDPVLMEDSSLREEAERNEKKDFILDRLDAWSLRFPKEELVTEAQNRHVPASPVTTPLDLAHDPQLIARGFLQEIEHPEFGRMMFPVGAIAGVRGSRPAPAPRLGQHNDEVLADLGYSEQERQALVESGAL